MSHWDRPAEEPQVVVPAGLPDLLKSFAKAVIKAQVRQLQPKICLWLMTSHQGGQPAYTGPPTHP